MPEVKLGRVDVTVANLAYTKSRAEQIQFSDPYYLAKEMLAVKASDPGNSKADFKGKRLGSTKGSTSELSIKMNGSEPVTFQDTGSAYMAVQQNKSVGMVANTMTITKLVNQSKTGGVPLKMIEEPMVFQPIGVGMKKDEPALLAKVNERADRAGQGRRDQSALGQVAGPEHRVQDDARRQGRAALRTEVHAAAVISRRGSRVQARDSTFIACDRSAANAKARPASRYESVAEISGLTSTSPLFSNSTAIANSSWKRNAPRRSNSLATIVFIGSVISPPRSHLHDDAARAQRVERAAQCALVAAGLEQHVEWPLSARERGQRFGLFGDVDRLVGADLQRAAQRERAMSVTTMCVAPARRAAMTVSAPIGPQPVTSTLLPSSGPARWTACSATASGSASAPSASLTQSASLWPGLLDDDLLAERALHVRRAHRAAVVAHVQAMVLQALLAVAAHAAGPAGADGDAVADREARNARAPTASIMPAISWPSTIGSFTRTVPKPPCWK